MSSNMDNFEYRNNRLHAEELDLNLIAEAIQHTNLRLL